MFFSFLICFDAVPEDTSEWKPETAPQAIVTKRIGNIYCPSTLKLVKLKITDGLLQYTDNRTNDHKDQQITVQIITG